MSILIIGEREQAELRAADARARKHPISIDELIRHAAPDKPVITIADRKGVLEREPELVMLPGGYRVALSYEYQPPGLCLHMSMSSPTPKDTVPRLEAIQMVLCALGMPMATAPDEWWIEEFLEGDRFGGRAVNVIVVVEPVNG